MSVGNTQSVFMTRYRKSDVFELSLRPCRCDKSPSIPQARVMVQEHAAQSRTILTITINE